MVGFEIPKVTLQVERLDVRPLAVPLREPFVIASARMTATRSVLVEVHARAEDGRAGVGWAEAATLPPVTREDEADVQRTLRGVANTLVGERVELGPEEGCALLDALLPGSPVARAGLEVALLDAAARLAHRPLRAFVGGPRGASTTRLVTDITLPIGEPGSMADRARDWGRRGFSIFKVKVGKDLDEDVRALEAISRAVPDASFRVDANAGFSARDAIAFADALVRLKLPFECYEQPCAASDLDAMAEVTEAVDAPVLADESVATRGDLLRVAARKAADGVNLKIAKSGGLLGALSVGREARRLGWKVMVGGMVETRLGMTAGAHLAAALGGVEFVDLDTAWLLATDPFEGGYDAEGPRYSLGPEPGLGVRERAISGAR